MLLPPPFPLLIVAILATASPRAMETTSPSASYTKAKASVEKVKPIAGSLSSLAGYFYVGVCRFPLVTIKIQATGNFAQVPTIGAKEVAQLREDGKNVLLVDVRTKEEMEVSMLRGALTREEFENSKQGEPMKTGRKFHESSAEGEEARDVVVPYCTVGYRSGQYAKKLIELGYPSVRNSEGVVLWTHEIGSGFVTRSAVSEKCEGGSGSGSDGSGVVEVKRVHVYGPPWDHASDDFETVKFTPTGWLGSTFKSAFSKVFGGKKS